MNLFDVIIIGGGPAGLNAAVVLGRCRRNVLLFDTGQQRNRHSHGIHNFLTREYILPADFIKIARKESRKYGARFKNTQVTNARKIKEGFFQVRDSKGSLYYAKKVLIATGLTDTLPPLEGLDKFYGRSVFHCPYCDGWEVKDKKIGVYAQNRDGFELAISLITWSRAVTYYAGRRNFLSPEEAQMLKQFKIPVITDPLQKLEGIAGKLKKVVSETNKQYACDALFFVNGYTQQSNLTEELGCRLDKKKNALTNKYQQTSVAGVYVAGDADKDMHFVVIAAAEGAKAAVAINKELQKEERAKRSNPFNTGTDV